MRLLPLLLLAACTAATLPPPPGLYVVVLGIAQDGGYPQAGCRRADCVERFDGRRGRAHVAALGIVDPGSGQRWIIDSDAGLSRAVAPAREDAGNRRRARTPGA